MIEILISMFFRWLITVPIAIAAIIIILTKNKSQGKNQNNNTNWNTNTQTYQNQYTRNNTAYSYNNKYQIKQLLTRNEWYEYKKLQKIATEKRLQICPKVRLLDIIEPRAGERDYITLLRKVQSKHVDFVICDQDLRIKAVLELDDGSHDQKDRQERDAFVDQILTGVGYKVIHVRSVTESTMDGLGEPVKADPEHLNLPN